MTAEAATTFIIYPGHAAWPTARLARLDEDDRPIQLYAIGDLGLLGGPNVGIVGVRAATGYGEHVTMELANAAVAGGMNVVSGGAYGIDGMAHRAALAASGNHGSGSTIAVLAGGLDRLYPAGHQELLKRVGKDGLLLSEYEPGESPNRDGFLRRNRLIAALSDAVIVVEAGMRSGSLNAVNWAMGMKIPVGAVPGPITSAASSGSNALLDGRAWPITSGHDLVSLVHRKQ
jgi:DNA processing protein